MKLATKSIRLLSLFGVLSALILLSASISNLKLLPGRAFPGASYSEDAKFLEKVVLNPVAYSFPFLEGVLALVFSGVLIYVVFRLFSFIKLKDVLRMVLVLVILLLVITLLPRTQINQVIADSGKLSEIATPPPQTYSVIPLGTPPPILIWLISFGLILGLSIPIFRILKQRLNSAELDDPILREAEIAATALLDGQNFADVILRCYFEMVNAIQLEQGISRERNLTVREFEQQLEELGFPSQPVQSLTMLFEKVRYGSETLRTEDEELALTSLNAISRYSKERIIQTNEAPL